METSNRKHVVIVGGGLVGPLNACFFAKRGYKVDLYELREDIRDQSHEFGGKSINLALSTRGIDALKAVGLDDLITENGIPMYARMIHDLNGNRKPIPYGKKHQFIMSIDRGRLNRLLLAAADEYQNVTLHFKSKLSSCDFEQGVSVFKTDSGEVKVKSDVIVGCDGAFSSVRRQIMKQIRLNFSQEYIPHGYMELRIPPTKDNNFAMEKNFLHIWPRNTFMMIALPDAEDNSFVVTLFMPFELFEGIKTADELLAFFQRTFPDSLAVLDKDELVKSYFERSALPLVSVKCSPYHIEGKAVILGDAGHAMVPFYGQGMNCGFEDCLILDEILDLFNDDFSLALPEYTRVRHHDAVAICDLAMYNYVEMRSSVNSKLFLVRKKLDGLLYWLLPNTWVPLYTSVAFTRIPYRQCMKNRKWQDEILAKLTYMSGLTAFIGGAYVCWTKSDDIQSNFQDGVLSHLYSSIQSLWS